MAQYFYDFKDIVATENAVKPAGFSPFLTFDSTNYYQQFSRSKDGMMDWTLRPSTWVAGEFTAGLRFSPTDVGPVADADVLYKFRVHDYTGGGFSNDGPGCFFRVNALSGTYTDGYEISIAGNPTLTNGFARRRVASVNTDVGTMSGVPSRANRVWTWARFRLRGTTLQARIWLDGGAEPGTWTFSATDTGLATPGHIILGANGSGAQGRRYEYAQISIGTGADNAPTTLPRTVAGTLLKPDGSPADGYLVRCFARETGQLLGETLANSVGSFAFTLGGYVKPVTVLGVDQIGNTWNCPVKDLINPGA